MGHEANRCGADDRHSANNRGASETQDVSREHDHADDDTCDEPDAEQDQCRASSPSIAGQYELDQVHDWVLMLHTPPPGVVLCRMAST
jgi:hypothetical protein